MIAKPLIRPVPLAEARQYSGAGYIVQEKMDGRFELLDWQRSIIAGERMRDGSFYAFDVAIVQGDDCRRSPYKDRWEALQSLASTFSDSMRLVTTGTGGEFLEHVLARGGEGCVFKHVDGYWGTWQFKAKRVETFDVRVTDILTGSVCVSFDGADAGRVPVQGRALQSLRVGDVVEIAAYSRTLAGKFREPRFIRRHLEKV